MKLSTQTLESSLQVKPDPTQIKIQLNLELEIRYGFTARYVFTYREFVLESEKISPLTILYL